MARQSPTGFAFGMLLEIAVVVVIVSLLPRFDLRPPVQAQEPTTSDMKEPPARLASFATNDARGRPQASPSPPLLSAHPPTAAAPSFPVVEYPQLASHEVEDRLDRASQQLVNTLGAATADIAGNRPYSASRPAWQQSIVSPPALTSPIGIAPQSSFAPYHLAPARSSLPPPGEAQPRRRWLNY